MSAQRRLNGWSASLSDVGMTRTVNEDSYAERLLADGGVWIVADGMGGHQAGDVASRMVVDTLQAIAQPTNLGALIDDAETRLQEVNLRLCQLAASSVPAQTIGSTVVALLWYRRQAACMWAGDSRVYRVREGVLERLTRDHTVVEELLAMHRLSPEEAVNHPESNVITRAVGGDRELCLEVRFAELCHGDRFLLCSDGLYNEVDAAEIRAALSQGDVAAAAHSLVRLALERGARDNVTVVVVEFTDEC